MGLSETSREKFVHIPTLLGNLFGISRSEARRAVAQNAVRADGRVVVRLDVPADEVEGRKITLGKSRRARVGSDLPAMTDADRRTLMPDSRPLPSALDQMTEAQIRASACAWQEIADMVEAGASDEEIATVARASVYRDQYDVKPEGRRPSARNEEIYDDLELLLRIAERERLQLLDTQENTTREDGRQLGLAMIRVREAFGDRSGPE